MANKKIGDRDKLLFAKANITVFENSNIISKKLNKCLESKKIRAEVNSCGYKNNLKIKAADIYIINTTDFTEEQKYTLVRKIIGIADHVYLFLLNEKMDIDVENISNELAHKKIQVEAENASLHFINCDEDGLSEVIKTINIIEITKQKINDLWRRVQEAC